MVRKSWGHNMVSMCIRIRGKHFKEKHQGSLEATGSLLRETPAGAPLVHWGLGPGQAETSPLQLLVLQGS